MENRDPHRGQMLRDLGLFGVILADVVGFTGVGVGLGYLAWKRFGWPWWIIVVTSMLGLTLAMFKILKLKKKS